MRDNRLIIALILLAIAGTIAIALMFPPVQAANYHVQQGETVGVGEYVDISSVIGWMNRDGNYRIAYYGQYGYSLDPQHIITIETKSKLYSFHIDPAIFSQRLGPWYQYYGNTTEDHGNTLAFRVVAVKNETPFLNLSAMVNHSPENQTQVPVPTPTILPVKHVSDYLIARGDPLAIPVSKTTKAWVFGYRDALYDYLSVNGTIEFTRDVISTLSPGKYTILLQNHKGNDTEFLVRYNNELQQIEWFDTVSFKVNSYGISAKTPQETLKKLKEVFPKTTDTFWELSLEVENPTISINQIDSTYSLNATRSVDYVGLDNIAFLDVRGYTNHIPDTVIMVCVDPVFNVSGIDSWTDAIAVKPEGGDGDMRAWRVTVPVDKYNMAPGRHFIGAKALSSGVITTADFYLYDNPEGTYIPDKTIRYISGRYGDQEIIPTPTPITIINTVEVTRTVTITIPVTPPDEQVKAQQKIVQDEKWNEAYKVMGIAIVSSVILYLVLKYLSRVYRRAKLK